MDIDQIIFKKLYKLVQRIRAPKASPELVQRTAELSALKGRLTVLARALTGQNIELFTAEREGGWSGRAFFLPAQFSHGSDRDTNIDFYIFRVCYLAVQQQLGLNWTSAGTIDIADSRKKAQQTAPAVLSQLYTLFPSIHPTAERLIAVEQHYHQHTPGDADLSFLWGRWMSPSETPASCAIPPASAQTPHTPPSTELHAPAREEVHALTIDEQEIQDYTLMHSFEKVETLEEFKGNWRDLDGADELSEHAESLAELDLRNTVRVDTPTHSVYQVEWFGSASAPLSRSTETEAPCLHYDEWDASHNRYKRNYCRVYPATSATGSSDYATATLQAHRRILTSIQRSLQRARTHRELCQRQPTGEEPDLDAVVTAFADIKAGHTPSDNIYLTRQRRQRDLSILLLIDISLSTDSYTGGRRIIDIEKQSVLLFGEVLANEGDRFRVDAFHSRTRNQCSYTTIRAFGDSWTVGKQRLGAIQPQGYTRIGPALRHATAIMAQETARNRWILLLSDGKPNDYDRYEGAYGIADVKQALREATQNHISVHALAVESEARFYLPAMFGKKGYSILPRPGDLPAALTNFYTSLLRS